MKLHRLELEGFGPFRQRQVVDFDAFDDGGIFLISGRTGAGKSSILDGVCFALYGMVPRYDGAGRRLRSDFSAPAEPTEVLLEFSAKRELYRVVRSPEYERPKARGEGVTSEKARVEVSVKDGGVWRALTTNAKEAGTLISEEIVGLTGSQFLQVILLAQNRFAEFLLAGNDERQALLRNLFGTRTYGAYELTLDTRRRESQRRLDKHGNHVEFLLNDAERLIAEHRLSGDAQDESAIASGVAPQTAARLTAIERAVQRARYAVEQADFARAVANEAYQGAEAAHSARKHLRDQQEKRAVAREALAALEARSASIAGERLRLKRAIEAEGLRASLETVASAQKVLEKLRRAEMEAASRWRALPGHTDLTDDQFTELIETITGQLAIWQAAASTEDEMLAHVAELATLDEALASDERALAAVAQRLAEVAARIPEVEIVLPPLEAEAARREAAEERVASLRLRSAAADDAERLRAISREADAQEAIAAREHSDAVAAVSSLLRRRLEGAAGEIASNLSAGEPCAVCGSIEHPKPAAPLEQRISEDDVAAAQEAAEAAAAAARLASEAARRARADLTDAIARAGSESCEQLTALLTEAEAMVRAAETASRERQMRADELSALRAEAERSRASSGAAAQRISAAREKRAHLAAQIESTDAAVRSARGHFSSINERIEDARQRRDRARDCVAARAEVVVADRALVVAATDLEQRITDSGFADAAEASAALLGAEVRAEIDDRIRAFEAELAGQRETLRVLEVELAGAPEMLADTNETESALAAAQADRDSHAELATEAVATARRLSDVHARAVEAHAATSVASAEHQVLAGIADAVAGRNVKKMDLETFVLAAELEEIVIAAARRLEEMSGGRYRLRHTDALAARNKASGLGLEIIDAHTAKARSPQSLSGGETFLASLALALGLAEVVTARAGGVKLDTLFIDEGFGSLDAETLELAMATLDELHQGGRTVGIISHVAAMKERITSHLDVEASAAGPSIIRQTAAISG
ncbi:AAA family ATPase [Microbacterium sp. NPDC076911]|uniref:AAA family ATPase n=1 Tax=Microbacterium sp. NPDC076911 TaxID=3154958 RepID=UPI003442DCEE